MKWSSPSELLLKSRALSLAVAEVVDDTRMKADLLASAATIEDYLEQTLSLLQLSREDVETRLTVLRESFAHWPSEISDESWRRLEKTRYLRDISDVVCDGGGFWEAIDAALIDEFGG